MGDQTLDTAQRFGQREILKRVHKALDSSDSAVYLEAHHRAKAVLLGDGDAVPRMRTEAGIVDPLYGGVAREQLGHQRRVLAMHAHARVQRAHTTKGEEAVERR